MELFRFRHFRVKIQNPVIWLLLCCWTASIRLSYQSEDDHLQIDQNTKYAVVVDAGSSGSRLKIYRWKQGDISRRLPSIEQIHTYKIRPGVHEAVDNPRELQTHILTLLSRATSKVSAKYRPTTPFYFMATAGMRLILEDKAHQATSYINDVLGNKSLNNFYYEPSNARILSGEEEGAFCWLAVNYLEGTFDSTSQETVGILELGGASTQIAFIPRGNILADKFPLRVAGRKYSVYVHSYLNYGQTFVERWIVERLLEENPHSEEVRNPCMIKDDHRIYFNTGRQKNITIRGSGNPESCSQLLDKLIYPANELWQCYPKPCSIGIIYQPTIPSTQKFYVLGAFVKALDALNVISEKTGKFRLDATYQSATQFCTKTIEEYKEEIPKRVPYVSADCLTSLYMYHLLTKAYGFAADTDQLHVHRHHSEKVTKPDWSLGAVLYEQENHFWNCPLDMKSSGWSTYYLSGSSTMVLLITMTVTCWIST